MEGQVKRYRVDGEVGRFEFETYRVEGQGGVVVDTADLFPPLTGQEWYRTEGFKEVGFVHGTINGSFRQTAAWFNRVRHQPEGTPGRTLSHNSEQEGERLLKHLSQKAEQVLSEHQFVLNQPPPQQQAPYQSQAMIGLDSESVLAAVKACAPDPSYEAEMLKNPVPYEVPADSVQVSIDPVGVKKQKESRAGSAKEKKRDMVYQTVAHLQQGERSYTLNGSDIGTVLSLILAFLLHNELSLDARARPHCRAWYGAGSVHDDTLAGATRCFELQHPKAAGDFQAIIPIQADRLRGKILADIA